MQCGIISGIITACSSYFKGSVITLTLAKHTTTQHQVHAVTSQLATTTQFTRYNIATTTQFTRCKPAGTVSQPGSRPPALAWPSPRRAGRGRVAVDKERQLTRNSAPSLMLHIPKCNVSSLSNVEKGGELKPSYLHGRH